MPPRFAGLLWQAYAHALQQPTNPAWAYILRCPVQLVAALGTGLYTALRCECLHGHPQAASPPTVVSSFSRTSLS